MRCYGNSLTKTPASVATRLAAVAGVYACPFDEDCLARGLNATEGRA